MAIRFVAAIIAALFLSAGATAAYTNPPVDTPAVVTLQLNDSATASPLSEQLPDTVTFENRMGTAQITRLAQPLDVAGAAVPPRYRSGDVAYWAAKQSLVVFLSDGSGVPRSGLVIVGHITGGLGHLANCPQTCTVRVAFDAGGI